LDIADALTDSLSRTGLGGMLVPFKVADGTLPAPGFAFSNETGLGIRRVAAGVMSFVNSGDDVLQILTDRMLSPMRADFSDVGLTVNHPGNEKWRIYNELGVLKLVPSLTPDMDDWNAAAEITIDALGNIVVSGNLQVDGTVTGNFDLGDSIATDIVVTNTVQATQFTGDFITVLQYIINANSAADPTVINFQVSQSWLASLSAPLTITSITGLEPGNIGRITFTGTGNAVTWPASVKWPGPTFTQPNLAAGPLDIAIVVLEYDGTNYLANASAY
jgi:hypothetical protein